MPITGKDLFAKHMTMILTRKPNEKQLFSCRPAAILPSALYANSKTGTNFASLTRMPFQKGPGKHIAKENKMFRNMKLYYFWISLKLYLAVNLSSSQNILLGATS